MTLHGVDDLKDLALVRNGRKGAVHKAHATGNALVVIDFGPALFIGFNGIHSAGRGAGPLDLGNGVVGALVHALAALDALRLVDVRVLLRVQIDGVPGADHLAGVRHTALAAVGHPHLLRGAGVTGERNDVDQRLFEKLVVCRGRLFNSRAGRSAHVHGLQRQSAGQPEPFLNDGPGQKNIAAVLGFLSRDNFIGDQVNAGIVPALIGKPCHLGKHVPANIVNGAVNASHCSFLRISFVLFIFRLGCFSII
ncbi:hypothetical protein SDC9_107653 [bioreactor metagenome]|uniref:Uncharacterized protein n=1 Tax=bioreactor metagenome TaxID=1076179 RepID=A0A645B5T6_9ZZZZ